MMENNYDKNNEELNRIRIENEKKRLILETDYGALFSDFNSDFVIPPEIENIFLDRILAIEAASNSENSVSLYEYLGNPSFNKLNDINVVDVDEELKKLVGLMNEKNVYLETLCEVDNSEMYRFIVEELFYEEIYVADIPDQNTHFIYEEFHPNQEFNIRNCANDFIHSYLDLNSSHFVDFLTVEAKEEQWHYHFRQSFNSFLINKFSIENLEFDNEKAKMWFDCDFVGDVAGSNDLIYFNGRGELFFKKEWGYWSVNKINIPQKI